MLVSTLKIIIKDSINYYFYIHNKILFHNTFHQFILNGLLVNIRTRTLASSCIAPSSDKHLMGHDMNRPFLIQLFCFYTLLWKFLSYTMIVALFHTMFVEIVITEKDDDSNRE